MGPPQAGATENGRGGFAKIAKAFDQSVTEGISFEANDRVLGYRWRSFKYLGRIRQLTVVMICGVRRI